MEDIMARRQDHLGDENPSFWWHRVRSRLIKMKIKSLI
jgi:hypothetical protein